MFCKDIINIIGSYLYSLNDIIAFHNVNKLTRQCKYDVTLYTRRKIPNFVYDEFNIVKICSTFTDYSNIDKLLTDKLIYISVSHRNKDDSNILNKLHSLVNLRAFRMFSRKFTNAMFEELIQLESLDLGQYQSSNFDGKCLTKLTNLTYLNLGENFICSKYVNNLTNLEHLFINTHINEYDFSTLINLKTLDVSKSDYTLTDSNISTLINLKNLRCRYSTITTVDHLTDLELLTLGVNYTMKSINGLQQLKALSIIDSDVKYLDLPNLSDLTLNEVITDNVLKNLTTLSYLYMGTNTRITDAGTNPLINLRYIHCNMNRNITYEGVTNATKLVYLHTGMSYIRLDKLTHLVNIQYAEQYDAYLGNLESVILLDNRTTIK